MDPEDPEIMKWKMFSSGMRAISISIVSLLIWLLIRGTIRGHCGDTMSPPLNTSLFMGSGAGPSKTAKVRKAHDLWYRNQESELQFYPPSYKKSMFNVEHEQVRGFCTI